MTSTKGIGVEAKAPAEKCNDARCPFHGHLKLHGKIFTGKIKSARMRKTATLEFERRVMVKKYRRYESKRTRLKVHNPDCIGAKEGDIVRVMECRPLSKTKNFVIIEKVG